jgi:diguanylate cyclase (GGDEF)-like protein/PAS domain S-box-containing protein
VPVPLDLADEHEALTHFLYIAPVGLAQSSIDGEIVMMNPISAQLLMPLSRDGKLTNLFTVLEDVAPELRALTASFDGPNGKICNALRIQLRAGVRGKYDPQMLSLTLLKLDPDRLMAVLSDITEEVKRERLLRQNEAWLNAILTGITDYALVSLDQHGRICDWNASIGRVTGFDRDSVLSQPFSMFYPDGATTPDRVLDQLREADENGWSLDDGWRKRADGTRFWGNSMIYPLDALAETSMATTPIARSGGDLPAYCLVIRDITDKREASESIRKATACDHLTGIANRRAFFDAAEIELTRWKRASRPLTLVLVDADHFKQVNDRYGHPAGDAVLRHLAATLTATFRECDVVARLGGEEFGVLLPSVALQGAVDAANRLLHAIDSAAVDVDGVLIRYTVSAGIASMDGTLPGLDALMKRADRALYAAKSAGRNRVECGGPL